MIWRKVFSKRRTIVHLRRLPHALRAPYSGTNPASAPGFSFGAGIMGSMTQTATPSLSAEQQQQLLEAARAAQRSAYAPYSRFQVGAAVLDDQGRIHAGCNVENAAYPEGVCAEASALSAMVLAGSTRLRAVLVVGTGGAWITPCGGCRQKLREFGAPDLPVLTANATEMGPRYTLAELLPQSFGPDHLGTAP